MKRRSQSPGLHSAAPAPRPSGAEGIPSHNPLHSARHTLLLGYSVSRAMARAGEYSAVMSFEPIAFSKHSGPPGDLVAKLGVNLVDRRRHRPAHLGTRGRRPRRRRDRGPARPGADPALGLDQRSRASPKLWAQLIAAPLVRGRRLSPDAPLLHDRLKTQIFFPCARVRRKFAYRGDGGSGNYCDGPIPSRHLYPPTPIANGDWPARHRSSRRFSDRARSRFSNGSMPNSARGSGAEEMMLDEMVADAEPAERGCGADSKDLAS